MRKREGKMSARLPVPAPAAKLMRTADVKAREVAKTDDVRRLGTLATELDDLRKIVGAVTGKRVDINRIAVPYVRAVVKGGRLLTAMADAGERRSGHGNQIAESRGATPPTLKELGFSKSRSSRWQLAGLLPDDALEELREGVFEKDDEIWGLAPVLRAAKAIELENKRAAYQSRADKGARVGDLIAMAEAGERFGVIYADPPWEFKVYSGKGKQRSAERHYDTSSLDAIKALPVEPLAADNCALFMWGVWPELPGALDVIKAWGFDYKTAGFIWVKQVSEKNPDPFTGMGYWTRANSEPCLLATRGSPERIAKDVHQVVMAPVGEHSVKPQEVRNRIERLLLGNYLELFARCSVPGWTVWGNEIEAMQKAAE